MGTFPFGAQVLPRGTDSPAGRHPVVVLGAYPSALHVRWIPPARFGAPVRALPVDNEPTPFWDGDRDDVARLFERWRGSFFHSGWGAVTPATLNGPSGRDLETKWLRPLGYQRVDAFITDCLPTARASVGVARRLADRYAPVVKALGAPPASLSPHPSENAIVNEALRSQRHRLTDQIVKANPEIIITLGNAAARVVASLGGQPEQSALLHEDTYGRERHVTIDRRVFRWQALVHPATPKVWADRHGVWAHAGT